MLVTFLSHAKTAEQIEMPFGRLTRVGPRNHVLVGVPVPQGEGPILGVVRPSEKHWEPSCGNYA